jgi:hypothetical protein
MENFSGKAVGNLKIELYNENGEVLYKQEKKNMIVHDAHAIVGHTMGNPGKKIKAKEKEIFENTGGKKTVELKRAEYQNIKMEVELAGVGSISEIELNSEKSFFDSVESVVLIDNGDLEETVEFNTGYKIENSSKEKVVFVTPIEESDYKKIIIKYTIKKDIPISIVPYSEKVKTGTGLLETEYKRGLVASDSALTYKINDKTGEILFETDKTNIVVEYEYFLPYGINFMSIGGLPAGHTLGNPFAYPTTAKRYKSMAEEFDNARQIVEFERNVEPASNEIRQFVKKDAALPDKLIYNIGLTDGPVLTIEKVTWKSGVGNSGSELSDIPAVRGLKLDDSVYIKNANAGEIELKAALYDSIPNGNTFQVEYKINSGTKVSYIADFPRGYPVVLKTETETFVASAVPVSEIITLSKEILNVKSVKHMPLNTPLVDGVDFDLNANPKEIDLTGYYSGSGVPTATDETVYGVDVNADPQIVLSETLSSATVTVKMTPAGGGATITLTPTTDYSVDLIGNFVDLTAYVSGTPTIDDDDEFLIEYITSAAVVINPTDSFVVEYETSSKKIDIYTVGMFTHQDKNTQDPTKPEYDKSSKMFNLSGIGPVTKDENIGMRINWSVTY